MSGISLGDFILDPRRVLYLTSLRVVVCTGLQQALCRTSDHALEDLIYRMDSILNEYKPESLVILDSLKEPTALSGIVQRWGKITRIQFVTKKPHSEAVTIAERLGCEVHEELFWDQYHFLQSFLPPNLKQPEIEIPLMQICGAPQQDKSYAVKVGNNPFAPARLAVFLKGPGHLILPSLDLKTNVQSVFQSELERDDVFAIGYARILPLGKIGDLRQLRRLGRGLPVKKAALIGRRRHGKPLV